MIQGETMARGRDVLRDGLLLILILLSIPAALFFRDSLLLLLVLLSILIVFFSRRKVVEWILGLLVLFFIIFYYSDPILRFISGDAFTNPLIDWTTQLLDADRTFFFDHWPQINVSIFGVTLLSTKIDDKFVPTLFPVVALYAGAIVHMVVMWFVPSKKLREFTREYWLYITSFLMLLLIISNILAWNFLLTFAVFLLVPLIIATGFYRLVPDSFILLLVLGGHILRWLWIALKYIAFFAVKIAKFLNNILKHLKELYDRYIRRPIEVLHEKLVTLENKQDQKVYEKLKGERLDESDYSNKSFLE